MELPDSIAFLPAPVSQIGAEIGRATAQDLLATMPEILRRARLGEYLTEDQACEESSITRRQLRHLRSSRQIPYIKRGRVVLVKTTDLFDYIEAGRIPAREPVAT